MKKYVQKTLEQNEWKSLNRYLNTQNLESQEINNEIERKSRIYNGLLLRQLWGLHCCCSKTS